MQDRVLAEPPPGRRNRITNVAITFRRDEPGRVDIANQRRTNSLIPFEVARALVDRTSS